MWKRTSLNSCTLPFLKYSTLATLCVLGLILLIQLTGIANNSRIGKRFITNFKTKSSDLNLLEPTYLPFWPTNINSGGDTEFELYIQKNLAKINFACAKYGTGIQAYHEKYMGNVTVRNAWEYWYLWVFIPKKSLFYCAIPKCGSTAMKHDLLEETGKLDPTLNMSNLPDITQLHVQAMIQFGTKDSESGRWKEMENRLLIIRNPWSRLVSAYRNKILQAKWPLSKVCPNSVKYQHIPPGNITFHMFTECIIEQSYSSEPIQSNIPKIDPHIMPMSLLCNICAYTYNIVVRMEDMENYTSTLLPKIGIHKTSNTAQINKSTVQTTKTQCTYRSYYEQLDSHTVKTLEKLYYYDNLIFFGYSKSPVEC